MTIILVNPPTGFPTLRQLYVHAVTGGLIDILVGQFTGLVLTVSGIKLAGSREDLSVLWCQPVLWDYIGGSDLMND